MAGILLGALCGAVELYLLNRLATAITVTGIVPIWLVPAKLFALVAFFLPVAFFFRDQLAHAGIAAAAVLMIGAVALFLRRKRGAES